MLKTTETLTTKRKLVFLVFLVFFSFSNVFAKESDLLAPWLEVLGKPLPKDFIRLDRTLFIKKDKSGLDVLVTIKDGVVIHSVLGAAFSSTDEAVVWAAPFYIVFEGIGTYYGQSKSGGDIYKINNAFALIDWLRLRADGLIARAVMFSLDLEYLKVQ